VNGRRRYYNPTVGLGILLLAFILLTHVEVVPAAPALRQAQDTARVRAFSLSDTRPKRSSSAIAIIADGATLLVVNPDSNSLTLVDTARQTVISSPWPNWATIGCASSTLLTCPPSPLSVSPIARTG
jgi:hypothetical protein